MNTQIQAYPGEATVSDGVAGGVRLGRQGDLIVSELQAKYYEQAYRGRLFSIDADSITLSGSAYTTKSAGGTIKFVNGFWNRPNSGVNAVIIGVTQATVSGTPAGPLYYNIYSSGNQVSSTGTGTIRSAIAGGAVNSKMTPLVNVAVAFQPADTNNFVQIGVVGGPAAIAAGAGIYSAYDDVAGKIIIPPGTVFGLTVTGAGTSHVLQSTLWWIEVPV